MALVVTLNTLSILIKPLEWFTIDGGSSAWFTSQLGLKTWLISSPYTEPTLGPNAVKKKSCVCRESNRRLCGGLENQLHHLGQEFPILLVGPGDKCICRIRARSGSSRCRVPGTRSTRQCPYRSCHQEQACSLKAKVGSKWGSYGTRHQF